MLHTLAKLLSTAAEAFRYFMQERAENHLAEKYRRWLKLPQGQGAAALNASA
ncbi:hypothetical protein [Hydrogenophaga aquatica]